jgi:hypothetical protein
MMTRCPDARVIGTSVIKDYRLLFKGSRSGSYLTIEPAKGYSVPVGVWEVTEQDERNLDCYEGFPNFYYKKELKLPIEGIRTGRIRVRDAFVYIMHEERLLGIPDRRYVRTCSQGYKQFGFDQRILEEALAYSKEA